LQAFYLFLGQVPLHGPTQKPKGLSKRRLVFTPAEFKVRRLNSYSGDTTAGITGVIFVATATAGTSVIIIMEIVFEATGVIEDTLTAVGTRIEPTNVTAISTAADIRADGDIMDTETRAVMVGDMDRTANIHRTTDIDRLQNDG